MSNRRLASSGFTIVELLIVIVVISILAAITVVSYNSIQARARIAVVQTDLQNIATQMNMFQIENGRYPGLWRASLSTADSEIAAVLTAANIYQTTRLTQADANAGKLPARSFIFCLNQDRSKYAVVAAQPIMNISYATGASFGGAQLYYTSSSVNGARTLTWDAARGDAGSNLCSSIGTDFEVSIGSSAGTGSGRWSFDIPTANAP